MANLDEGRIGFPVPKKTPFRKITSIFFMKMRENGAIYREQKTSVPTMPNCFEVNFFSTASFFDVFTAFVVFLTGMFIAILVCKLRSDF